MKRLLAYLFLVLVLTFSLQSWTHAEDITEFEIDGISVGDNLFDHYSKKEIKEGRLYEYKDSKFVGLQLNTKKSTLVFDRHISNLTLLSLILLVIQVLSGTEIRQFVDLEMVLNNYSEKNKWLMNPPQSFYFHRSFSIIIIAVNISFDFCNKMIFVSEISN